MILRCSRGHEFDTVRDVWHGNLRDGGRCPMEMSYDRMDGSTYCRRILRPIPADEVRVEEKES